MVITSSTQWTVPLSSSSLSASPPSLTRQGSVLGLKTCQLSAPQHAMNASSELHHQDLHSTSSRRLQGTEYVPSRRSAGSFRHLVSEDFCAKLAHEDTPCPGSPDWVSNNKGLECKYDGIAMPWSSSPLHTLDIAVSDSALKGNLVDVQGDITADDVDLLPMPGLLSCPSPFYADSNYLPHTQSPYTSKSVDISSPQSSANGSKSSVMVPNYLGLPPEFSAEVRNIAGEYTGLADGMCHASAPLTPPVNIEHVRSGGNHLACGAHAYVGKDTHSFADSLAGLWSNTVINSDPEYMHHDSESLASMFNVYPQNFHGFSSSDESCIEPCVSESGQLIMDDLQYLINPGQEGGEEKGKGNGSHHGSHAGKASEVNDNCKSIMMEGSYAHGQSCNVILQSNANGQKSPVKCTGVDTSTMSCISGLSYAATDMETASPLKKNCESIGIKRPFSTLDLASMASSIISTSACISGSNAWRPQPNGMGLPMPTEEHEESHSFSSFLYKSQKDPKLAGGLYYHTATNLGGIMNEDTMPKPPPTKVRRKHGTAMDPQSVAARTRREKFSDRIRILQSLVPNGERLDTVSMLGQTLEYVRFLQHQVWELYHGKDPISSNSTCDKWKDFVEAAHASTN